MWGDAAEAVNERNDVWSSRDAEKVIVFKMFKEMYREWIMSQHLASTWASHTLRSISQMDYLPNGPWQRSFLWVVSNTSNVFHSAKSEHCCCLSVCFKTRFTSTYTFYLFACFYLCLLSFFIIHLCFSGNKVMDRDIVTGTVCNCKAERQDWLHCISIILYAPFFSEGPSHHLQINQVDHILATD